MLLRVGREDGGDGVPVVGRAYADGVDVLPGEQLAQVAVAFDALLLRAIGLLLGVVLGDALERRLEAVRLAAEIVARLLLDVAQRDDLHVGVGGESHHVIVALPAHADAAQDGAIGRCDRAVLAERAGGDDRRKPERGRRGDGARAGFECVTTGQLVVLRGHE